MELQSQKPMFSDDPSTKGFDLSSGKAWIYPENYPTREYQFSIVKSALYHNTLVCLPTGLGKTFIAAVVMYNFWRWYPQGKIVFLAPTKPLVAQQINACHDIMGISSEETIELTGATDQRKRQVAWLEHRVIFATPQVFHKDLEKNIVPSELVKCVVVDEAHKALGKHSYCESIRILSEQNPYFRVLGLSATPGGKLDAVQEVVRNLHITHLELRDDTSPDIIPYINERKLDIILVGLGDELERFKDRYITIMDRHVRVLVEHNVVRGNTGNISKGRIFMIQKEYSQKAQRGQNHGQIMKTLTILMTMYHAYELMVRHGLRAFCNFYQNHQDKFWLKNEPELIQLLEEISYYLGPFPNIEPLPDGSVPEIPDGIRFGHNKFHKLKELLLRHFERFEDKEDNTRAIVFVEYRDIVNEVYVLLLQSRPLLRPQKFVGQAGQKQRQQKLALENFRSNKVNVLISTCVGEEGLDVGEVDLIICFDTSQVSPTRLVQRMGRTGRKRDGHIIVLVTDGKEHQTLRSALSRRDSLNNKVLQSSGIIEALHETSPRMVPPEFNPECYKMHVTVLPKNVASKAQGKMKEAKKTRKRAETNKKTKNGKISEPSTSNNKPASQSSMMKFLKRTRDEAELDDDEDIVGITTKHPRPQTIQNSQQSLKNNNTIKLSNVKLLSSDSAAIDFLTLCTMKRSQNEQTNSNNTKKNSYFPAYHAKNHRIDVFLNFKVPDLKTLDCLKNITDYVAPVQENYKEEELMIPDENYCLDEDYHVGYNSPPRSQVAMQESRFEELLDESTSDSNVSISRLPEVRSDDFPATEEVDWGANENDFKFDDVIDGWSDDSIKYLENKDVEEEKVDKEDKMDDQVPSKFEDILNYSSDDSDATHYSPQKNAEPPTEQQLNVTSAKQMEMNESKAIEIKDELPCSRFEDILNCSSGDSDATLYSPQKKAESPVEQKWNVATIQPFRISTAKKKRKSDQQAICDDSKEDKTEDQLPSKFEDMLNCSSDDSDATLYSPEKKAELSVGQGRNLKQSIKKSSNDVGDRELVEKSRQSASRNLFEAMLDDGDDDDADIDLLGGDGVQEKSAISTDETNRRHFQIISEFNEASTSGVAKNSHQSALEKSNLKVPEMREKSQLLDDDEDTQLLVNELDRQFNMIASNPNNASANNSQNDCKQTPSSMMTISQTLREVERINASRVNNVTEDRRSPIVSDLRQDSRNSRSVASIHDSANKVTSRTINEPVEDNTQSDEDIFGDDDLLVDSDFEQEINKIEKSAESDVNTSDKQTSFDASAKIADIEAGECEILFVKETPKKVVQSFIPSSAKSNVAELAVEEFDWDSDISKDYSAVSDAPSSSKKNSEDSNRNRKVACEFEKSFGDSLSKSRTVYEQTLPSASEKQIDNKVCNKNSPLTSAQSAVPEIILDDCDWGSDFEAFSTPLKTCASNSRRADNDSTPKSSNNFVNDTAKNSRPGVKFSRIEDSKGWISTEKPKLRLTLGEKLSKNLLTKLTPKKPSPVKHDSDSENEFAVARITTAGAKEVERGYFAKPADPVDKLKRPGSLGMLNNPRRVMRVPLALRRTDANKVNVQDMKDFSAPAKYTQQQRFQQQHKPQRDITSDRGVGAGRQKSASLDLGTKKKKKLHQKDERRPRAKSEFLDYEAEVSSDEGHTSGSSGVDEDLEGFVSYTQHIDDSVDMQAHYLQTVRSPRRPGGFHFRKTKSPSPDFQIYSQALPDEPNSYMHDSFCVAEDDDDVFEDDETPDEMSLLEQIELSLKSKKRKRGCSASDTRAKRKRKLRVPSSETSSSEDETEKLRQQIQDESFALRNNCE